MRSTRPLLCGTFVFILVACDGGLGQITPETACTIGTLLDSAASTVESGAESNRSGDLEAAVQAGEQATRLGDELHAILSELTGASVQILAELESAAVSTQQAGIYLNTGSPSPGPSEENLARAATAIRHTAEQWASRLEDAQIDCL